MDMNCKACGRVVVTEDKYGSLIAELRRVKVPDVRIGMHPDMVGYVHRRTETEDIYFISNINKKGYEETIKFTNKRNGFCVFDPMSGQEKAIRSVSEEVDGIEVKLYLEAFQSLIFVFGSGMEQPLTETKPEESGLLDISCGWTLEVPERSVQRSYDQLESWEQEAGA